MLAPTAQADQADSVSAVTRRGLLMVAGALATVPIVGCTDDGAQPGPTSPEPPSTPSPGSSADPDLSVRQRISSMELQLAALYDAALQRLTNLSKDLTAIRDHHRAHAAAVLPPSAETNTPSPATSATPVPTPTFPPDQAGAIALLLARENMLRREQLAALASCKAPELARVLTLCAASEGSHAILLTGFGR